MTSDYERVGIRLRRHSIATKHMTLIRNPERLETTLSIRTFHLQTDR